MNPENEKRPVPCGSRARETSGNQLETFEVPLKPGQPTETKFCWLQDAAFDLIQLDAVPRGDFALAYCTYTALCAVGSDTESEPGPDRDGRPIQIRVATIAQMVNQPIKATANRIRGFVRLGLVDPVDVPKDGLALFTVRLRKLDEDGGVL